MTSRAPDPGRRPRPRAVLDTNVLIRHLTGDPPDQAERATQYLRDADEGALLLADLVVAELMYVLQSLYRLPRPRVAALVRAVLAFRAVTVVDPGLLLRAVEVYDVDRLHFAEAYLVALAERSGVAAVVSFDRDIDRVRTVRRVEPPDADGAS